MIAAKIMLEGLWLEFTGSPKLFLKCPPALVTSQGQALKLEEFIDPWLETGIIAEEVSGEEGFFSRLFTVPKDKNKLRPIIDLSSLNLKIKKYHSRCRI